ncbi:MAG: hypothetical protein VX519_02370 [Myxococcota bacterium]|nr:hypothetical protein [Myxococcota bacterium]
MGLPVHAVVRCVQPVAEDQVVLGSDHGLVLLSDTAATPVPFPKGSRKEARDVLSLAWHNNTLHIATSRGQYTWDLKSPLNGRGLPKDGSGGFDDLRALYSTGNRLLKAWRTHTEGGAGPADVLCFTQDDQENVFVGTSDGVLAQLDGPELERYRTNGHTAPVRHLAWCQETLWIAAGGALHRHTTTTRDSRPGEPLALCTDDQDRLWAIERNRLAVGYGDWPSPLGVELERPWCLAASETALWVGARGGLYRFYFSEFASQT